MFNRIIRPYRGVAAVLLMLSGAPAAADDSETFHVTITNLTHAVNFTPILVASHRGGPSIFEPGAPASAEMAAVAEAGNLEPLTALLQASPRVVDVQNSGGLLTPGRSVTVIVRAGRGARQISLVSMMLPTNDGFIGLDGIDAPRRGGALHYSVGYDAGTEANDELCVNIPGPTCGGTGPSPGVNPGDEGYVHVHRGTHGAGDLNAATYDWRNPVARIEIRRVGDDD